MNVRFHRKFSGVDGIKSELWRCRRIRNDRNDTRCPQSQLRLGSTCRSICCLALPGRDSSDGRTSRNWMPYLISSIYRIWQDRILLQTVYCCCACFPPRPPRAPVKLPDVALRAPIENVGYIPRTVYHCDDLDWLFRSKINHKVRSNRPES